MFIASACYGTYSPAIGATGIMIFSDLERLTSILKAEGLDF